MGAIVKTIELHQDNLQPVLNYGTNKEKTELGENNLDDLLSYAENNQKTTLIIPDENEKEILVSGIGCNPNTAQEEFARARNKYREENPELLPSFDYLDKRTGEVTKVQKQPVTAVHVIQSFNERDIDPRIAHQIGVELCERLGVQAVVATHLNTDHFHNHIVINGYLPNGVEKFYMNNEKRFELRRMSDEIQREYGLEISFMDPELQLRVSKHSINYREWEASREGKSWKDNMRDDIRVAKDIAENRDEFIEVMKEYGYDVVKEKGSDSILWSNSENGKNIWDKTLGEEFMMKNLFPDEQPGPELVVQTPDDIKQKHSEPIHVISVARYDYSGRRRSDLELLIRRTIAIIQRVANKLRHLGDTKQQTKYNASGKIAKLQEALNTMKYFNIENIEDLNNKINIAGKNVNITKNALSRTNAEMEYYKVVKKLIEQYQDAKTLYDSVRIWNSVHDLHINQYSQYDINSSIAYIAPLSPKQKSELYELMKSHPELRISEPGKEYKNVSVIQFGQIRDYFKGVSPKPECLLSSSDNAASTAYEKQYRILSERMTYEPSAKQKEQAVALLKEHGHNLNENTITMADYININNCYGPNPFQSPLITESQKQHLENILKQIKKTTNRDVSQIMLSEYNQILSYANGADKRIPDILKEELPASETDILKVKKMLVKTGHTSTVSIDDMTQTDARNFYNWMISQDHEPMCVNQTNAATWHHNKETFHSEIENETARKQEVLIGYRNAINALAQLGINVEDIPEVLKQIIDAELKVQELTETRDTFSESYKELLRLKQQVSYSTDKTFLFGSIFDKAEIKQMEQEIKDKEDTRDKEAEIEDTATTSAKDEERKQKKHRVLDIGFDL